MVYKYKIGILPSFGQISSIPISHLYKYATDNTYAIYSHHRHESNSMYSLNLTMFYFLHRHLIKQSNILITNSFQTIYGHMDIIVNILINY